MGQYFYLAVTLKYFTTELENLFFKGHIFDRTSLNLSAKRDCEGFLQDNIFNIAFRIQFIL